MSDIEKYKQSQVEVARKIIFEQDKEVLRETAQQLLRSNNTIALDLIKPTVDLEKIIHIAKTQEALIKKLQKKKSE